VPQFYVLPHCYVAQSHKVASSALARAIVEVYHPELVARNALLPPGFEPVDGMSFRNLAPLTEAPDKRVLLAVRDPVERFRSALGMLGWTVEETLAMLPTTVDPHLARQVELTRHGQETVVYRYPLDLERLCADAGLPFPLRVVNAGRWPKPHLTARQRSRVEEHYAEDMELLC
jgi:hypothetical protein